MGGGEEGEGGGGAVGGGGGGGGGGAGKNTTSSLRMLAPTRAEQEQPGFPARVGSRWPLHAGS